MNCKFALLILAWASLACSSSGLFGGAPALPDTPEPSGEEGTAPPAALSTATPSPHARVETGTRLTLSS